MDKLFMYVCQLPQLEQQNIIKECKEVFINLPYVVNIEEEIENVLSSKLIDLQEIINIKKYLYEENKNET